MISLRNHVDMFMKLWERGEDFIIGSGADALVKRAIYIVVDNERYMMTMRQSYDKEVGRTYIHFTVGNIFSVCVTPNGHPRDAFFELVSDDHELVEDIIMFLKLTGGENDD